MFMENITHAFFDEVKDIFDRLYFNDTNKEND